MAAGCRAGWLLDVEFVVLAGWYVIMEQCLTGVLQSN